MESYLKSGGYETEFSGDLILQQHTNNGISIKLETERSYEHLPFDFSKLQSSIEFNQYAIPDMNSHSIGNSEPLCTDIVPISQQINNPTTITTPSSAIHSSVMQALSSSNQSIVSFQSIQAEYFDITPYITLSQERAAKKLGIPKSTLSKRWREATCNRKWPYRQLCKVDREIKTLVHNMHSQVGSTIDTQLQSNLASLMKLRQDESRVVYIKGVLPGNGVDRKDSYSSEEIEDPIVNTNNHTNVNISTTNNTSNHTNTNTNTNNNTNTNTTNNNANSNTNTNIVQYQPQIPQTQSQPIQQQHQHQQPQLQPQPQPQPHIHQHLPGSLNHLIPSHMSHLSTNHIIKDTTSHNNSNNNNNHSNSNNGQNVPMRNLQQLKNDLLGIWNETLHGTLNDFHRTNTVNHNNHNNNNNTIHTQLTNTTTTTNNNNNNNYYTSTNTNHNLLINPHHINTDPN